MVRTTGNDETELRATDPLALWVHEEGFRSGQGNGSSRIGVPVSVSCLPFVNGFARVGIPNRPLVIVGCVFDFEFGFRALGLRSAHVVRDERAAYEIWVQGLPSSLES